MNPFVIPSSNLPLADKRSDRIALEAKMRAFKKRGGKIIKIPAGVQTDRYTSRREGNTASMKRKLVRDADTDLMTSDDD